MYQDLSYQVTTGSTSYNSHIVIIFYSKFNSSSSFSVQNVTNL